MTVTKQIIQQIEHLRKKINEHNYHYYVLDNPAITDAEFDELFEKIKKSWN